MRHPGLLLLLLLLMRAPGARAQDAKLEAKAHADQGTRYYEVQDYARAAAEYEKAYLLDAQPDYLYALAQSQRLGGDCDKAIRSYQSYLRTTPPEAEADKARKNIARCEEERAKAAASQPATQPARPVERIVVVERPAPAPARPWTQDVVGHALAGGGVVVLGTGVWLWRSGEERIADLNGASTYGEFARRREDVDGARLRQRLGVGGVALGAALVAAGVTHYLLFARDGEPIAAVPTEGGALLVLGGRF